MKIAPTRSRVLRCRAVSCPEQAGRVVSPVPPSSQAARRILRAASGVLVSCASSVALACSAHHKVLAQTCPVQEVAQVAGILGLPDGGDVNETIDAFTLQGTTEKQYRIEELEGTKIVRRRPGVSVKTCIKVVQTAQTGGLGQYDAPEDSICRGAEDRSNVRKACVLSCKSACDDSLDAYRKDAAELGLPPTEQQLERPKRKCARNCAYECQKEGSGYRFTVNYGG